MNENLGKKARDGVTGFEGTITGFCEYLTGCAQYLLVPTVGEDRRMLESAWFDVQRVTVFDGDPLRFDNSETPGPDKSPSRRW